MMTKKLQFLLAVFLLVLAIPTLALAAPEKVEDRVKALEDEIRILKSQEDHYQYLKEDTKEFRSHAESEMKSFRESIIEERRGFLNWIKIIFAVITIGTGVLTYFFGKSVFEWKNDLKDHFNEQKERIDKSVDRKETELSLQLEKGMLEIDKGMDELKKMVDERISLKECRVLVTGDEQLITRDRFVLNEIENRGIKQLHEITFDIESVKSMVDENKVDIILFFCINHDWITQLEETEKFLTMKEKAGSIIPLLIYYPNRGLDRKGYKNYNWAQISNFPTTLISSLISLAAVYNKSSK